MSKPDLTLLYYSASALPGDYGVNLRNKLLEVTDNKFPVISVTQKPIDFGKNICIGEIGQSYYNIYRQMYTGIQEVETRYVALIEDDSMYAPEHFENRPTSDNVFCYNKNMWFLDGDIFWTRGDSGTLNCIAPTKLLHMVLKRRFDRFPVEPIPRNYQKYFWGEPGTFESKLGFPNIEVEYFPSKIPNLTLVYREATFGRPRRRRRAIVETDKEYWGNAYELNKHLIGEKHSDHIWHVKI